MGGAGHVYPGGWAAGDTGEPRSLALRAVGCVCGTCVGVGGGKAGTSCSLVLDRKVTSLGVPIFGTICLVRT